MFCKKCYFATASTPEGLCADCADGSVSAPGVAPKPAPPGTPVPSPLPTGPVTRPHGPAQLRSPVGLGTAVAVVLGLVIVMDLFAVWSDFKMYDVTGALLDGDHGDAVLREAEDADTYYALAGYAQMITFLAAGVVYLVWFMRARVNAEVFDPFGHSKKRIWAGWCWFVPIVNMWFPRRIMLDIWDASSPVGSRRSHWLVNVWWTVWIVSALAARSQFTSEGSTDAPQEMHDVSSQIVFADVTDMVAAVLAILVVLRLTRMQNEKAHQGQGAVPVGP